MAADTPPPSAPLPPAIERFAVHVDALLEERDRLHATAVALAAELPSSVCQQQMNQLAAEIQGGQKGTALCATSASIGALLPLSAAAVNDCPIGTQARLLLDQTELERDAGRIRWRGLVYPAVVLLLAGIVFAFLSIYVLPIFRNVFQGFAISLPPWTEATLFFGRWIERQPATVACIGFLIIVTSTAFGWWFVGKVFPRLGAWGSGTSKDLIAAARMIQRIADAQMAGLSLTASLQIAGALERQPAVRRGLLDAARNLAEGRDPVAVHDVRQRALAVS